MCWRSNDTVIKKVAERDFYVYKIGKIVWNNIFISDIRGYNYAPKCPNRIVPLVPYNLCVNSYIIDRGYHSYKWIALEDTYPNERCLCLGNYNSALKENISLYKGCCIATFIVPEGAEIGIFEIPVGATVYINYAYREVVSTDIKYLGLLEEI